MKQLVIIFIFFVLMNINANGQRDQENTYYPSEYLKKFVGDWIWYSGSDTVRLQFKKVALNIPDVNNSYWENLIGCHKYVKNGVIIESSLADYDSLQYYNYNNIGTIILFSLNYGDTSHVGGTLSDRSKNKGNQIDLTYLGGSPAQIRMQLSAKPGATVSLPGNPYIDGITLPTDIILFKQ